MGKYGKMIDGKWDVKIWYRKEKRDIFSTEPAAIAMEGMEKG